MRRADEHFDHVVVQAVVELPLKSPLELRMIEVAGMKFEQIGMHRHRRILEVNDDLYRFTLGASGEIEQRMLVEFQLGEHTFEPRVCFGHS